MFDVNKGVKLKKLYVENYKVLKDFEIDFCDENKVPLPLVVLAGVNGSGKTSVLESIVDSYKTKSKVELLNDGKIINPNITLFTSSIKYGSIKSKGKEIIYIPFNISKIDFVEKIIVEFIDKLIYEMDVKASETYGKCAEFIKTTLDDIELNISFLKLDKSKKVYFKKNNNEFLLENLSSGEKSLLARLLYLYFAGIENKIILIDEPELSLHPTWQDKILKLYKNYAIKNNCQIIIATHSPLILGSAENKSIRILYFEDNKVKVLKNIFAYGRDYDWILEEVMGLDYVRNIEIHKTMEEIYSLIEFNKLEQAEEEIEKLENIIGSNDKDVLKLRNEIDFKRIDFEEDN